MIDRFQESNYDNDFTVIFNFFDCKCRDSLIFNPAKMQLAFFFADRAQLTRKLLSCTAYRNNNVAS